MLLIIHNGFRLVLSVLVLLLLTGCAGEVPDPGQAGGGDPGKPDRYGRWHPARPRAAAPDETGEETLARLEAIGYLSGSREAGTESGVLIHCKALSSGGYNLYVSGHGPEAILTDMDGQVLHKWRYSSQDIWPETPKPYNLKRNKTRPKKKTKSGIAKKMAESTADVDFFRNAHLYPNGDLVAIFEGRGLIRLDRDSNLLWASRCGAHHDLDLLENGDILVLTREAGINKLVNEDKPILEDFITTIGPGGEVKDSVSLVRCFARSPQFEDIWRSSDNKTGDIFHTNTLFLLGDPPLGSPPAFSAGRILTGMRMLHAVAVVDLEQERVVWARRGRFKAQHDPRLLDNGNVLLFDNLGVPSCSRVLEFDLESWKPVWSYVGSPEQPFFSETCGTCQRLENGNTLITESDGGRAFEVTPDGQVVWEFLNPHRAGDRGQFIASLFTVKRLDSGFPLDWIPGSPP